jgi:hypothetical protein
VGEARRHVCAVGVRVARLALASAPYTTRSLRSYEEATIKLDLTLGWGGGRNFTPTPTPYRGGVPKKSSGSPNKRGVFRGHS